MLASSPSALHPTLGCNPALSPLMCTKGHFVSREKGAIVRTEQNTILSSGGSMPPSLLSLAF